MISKIMREMVGRRESAGVERCISAPQLHFSKRRRGCHETINSLSEGMCDRASLCNLPDTNSRGKRALTGSTRNDVMGYVAVLRLNAIAYCQYVRRIWRELTER